MLMTEQIMPILMKNYGDIGAAPACFTTMQGRVIEYMPDKSLTVSFPVLDLT